MSDACRDTYNEGYKHQCFLKCKKTLLQKYKNFKNFFNLGVRDFYFQKYNNILFF